MASVGVPPGPDENQGPLLIVISTVLHSISLPLYGARIWSRTVPTRRLALDDFLITAAVICDLVNWILLLVAIHYGVGRHNFYVPEPDRILAEKFLFISQPTYPWSLTFSKMSIAWMLIRIRRDSRQWVITMAGMMVLSLGIAINSNAFQLTVCTPLWAVWDHSDPNAKCMDKDVAQASIYVNSSLTIATDFFLSFAPITFIVGMKRPRREKIVLACVMGMGVIASAGSVAKTFRVKDYGVTGDTLMDSVMLTLWCVLEMQLAIMASCIPTLKQLFERSLRRAGLLSSSARTPHHLPLSTIQSNHHSRISKKESSRDSIESELPIMKPGMMTTINADRDRISPSPSTRHPGLHRGHADDPTSSQEDMIHFSSTRDMETGMMGGIQKKTTVEVVTLRVSEDGRPHAL